MFGELTLRRCVSQNWILYLMYFLQLLLSIWIHICCHKMLFQKRRFGFRSRKGISIQSLSVHHHGTDDCISSYIYSRMHYRKGYNILSVRSQRIFIDAQITSVCSESSELPEQEIQHIPTQHTYRPAIYFIDIYTHNFFIRYTSNLLILQVYTHLHCYTYKSFSIQSCQHRHYHTHIIHIPSWFQLIRSFHGRFTPAFTSPLKRSPFNDVDTTARTTLLCV